MPRSTLLAVLAAACSLLAPARARAEFPDPAFYIGIFGGENLVLRDWDLGGNAHQAGTQQMPFGPGPGRDSATTSDLLPGHSLVGGLRLGVQVMPRLSIEGEVALLPISSTARGSNTALFWDVNVLIHLLRSSWTPVIEFGAGAYHNLSGDLGKDMDPRIHVGLGLRGLLTRWLALRVDVRDVITDGFDTVGGNNLEILVGVDFLVCHGPGDRDGDGVRDNKDACPDVAGPATNNGCPTTDRDGDGVPDAADVCPDLPAGPTPDPRRRGCPSPGGDRDKDGVLDGQDECIDVPAGATPDPLRPGCPSDRDRDGFPDGDDQCPDVPAGKFSDAIRVGCPADRDHDGVPDADDACPDVAAGKYPDPGRVGCPADRDGDGVLDEQDACMDVPAGKNPDTKRAGCPADRDGDSIADDVDACPDKAGAPDPDPKKNGCPGLVKIEGGKILLLDQVYFATGKDVILPRSFRVLQAVFHAVKALPAGRTVRVEGHTDDRGDAARNTDLSQRRADAVKKWLTDKGLAAALLDAKGFGSARPLEPNRNEKARARNRRVEFHISDPGAAQ
jgi:outer membrane protein OmpA-like peptidoglycan-associated protein